MTPTTREFIAALGRLLLEIAGEAAPAATPATAEDCSAVAPTQEEPKPHGLKGFKRPLRTVTCVVCGAEFQSGASRAKYCDKCRHEAQMEKLYRLNVRKAAGEPPAPQPAAPAVPDGMVRCERMHATIAASVCGTRGECQGKKDGRLCEHLPK